jgi:hypothetical protein
MNRASLDRGFGRCIVLKKYGATLKRYPNRAKDRITAPGVSRECSDGWVGSWGGLARLPSTGPRRLSPPPKPPTSPPPPGQP